MFDKISSLTLSTLLIFSSARAAEIQMVPSSTELAFKDLEQQIHLNRIEIAAQIALSTILVSSIETSRFVNQHLGLDRTTVAIAIPAVFGSTLAGARVTAQLTAMPIEQRVWLEKIEKYLDQEIRLETRLNLLETLRSDDMTLFRVRARLKELREIKAAHLIVEPRISPSLGTRVARGLRSWPVVTVGGVALSYIITGETAFVVFEESRLDAIVQNLNSDIARLKQVLKDSQP
ncbi:MAG: hypothetical protein K2Q26_09250 [Bdellovibrionales bacterium]|nr:hypothetical protein [Bdellovibrionales bacterium]